MNARCDQDHTEELRDQQIAELARKHAAATRTNILTGNEKVLHDISNDLGRRLNQKGVSECLVRTAIACGPLTAGNMLIDLIQKCIDADAENEVLEEVKRLERASRTEREDVRMAGALAYMMAG